AGVGPSSSRGETARRIEAKIKGEMAGWLGMEPDATWQDVGQGIEARTKEALGGWAGASAADDWDVVGRKIEARTRERVARWSGVEEPEEARWDAISRRVDSRMRAGLGSWVGAPEDADWRSIAGQIGARVSHQLEEWFGRRKGQGLAGETAEPTKEEPTVSSTTGGEGVRREEFRVSGTELLERFKQLVHEGNVRRVIIKQDDRVLVEFPLTLGVVGALLAPTLAAVGAIAALVAECTIVVERRA
ncbi:MAG: DUF4342 domain-containing protein, partial [Anaerolineae bacterium]|nr:DUF4342 domain-containing protein [Anaerolineae bacterium]